MGCTLTTEEVAHIDRTIADLKAENAKLRELVRISIEYCANGRCGSEDGCPMPTTSVGPYGCLYVDKARELGVEV